MPLPETGKIMKRGIGCCGKFKMLVSECDTEFDFAGVVLEVESLLWLDEATCKRCKDTNIPYNTADRL